MYDPYTGRFLQEDPEGFDAGDINLYLYVHNSPVNFTDPSGLERLGGSPPECTRRALEEQEMLRRQREYWEGIRIANLQSLPIGQGLWGHNFWATVFFMVVPLTNEGSFAKDFETPLKGCKEPYTCSKTIDLKSNAVTV